ncbi:MAG: RIP metalloprotease RseP [Gammaproteobacteria bacterium]
MSGFAGSLLSFVVAISILVAVHEFGHFWVARKAGIKVLRFSIGFGKPLYKKILGEDKTEFTISMIPLGGYVKMLDEREADVSEHEVSRSFNRQSLSKRSAVLVAGPAFNFLFAILAYWVIFIGGVPGLKPVIGEITGESFAEQSGFRPGDEIVSINDTETPTWDMTNVALLDAALSQEEIALTVKGDDGLQRALVLDFTQIDNALDNGSFLSNLGLAPVRPPLPAIIDGLVSSGAAQNAGFLAGDSIIEADGQPISDWYDWVEYIRERPGIAIVSVVNRGGELLTLSLTPESVGEGGESIGRIGAYVKQPDPETNPYAVVLRYNPLSAFKKAIVKTWDMSALTVQSLWSMLTGHVSIKNISGPISIAQYANYSAQDGIISFIRFLAFVSISLGVLNLLPVPVLDGGHLLYNAIEWMTGKPLSQAAQETGLRLGVVLLILLMGVAFYNDLSRLFGA